ncbi:hypothetical protein TOPH_07692 [Tolypocladium ophioglossoides CBS 100239]|uniref:Uncharacterized protein n=1 Tax=Tolypocladium ophioglossoides (strain CBS 100239) TaxID=1163406 RepID=A0A0L0N0V7_TOLOC|nr:hypothetical protein TOPH_07692 [Tolypocladium ophioglossoides CBS 100239]
MALSPSPADVLFVARERWGPRTHIVFDIFNLDYDPDVAHIEGRNDLSVITIFFTRGTDMVVSDAGMPVANAVNKGIRDIHDLEGLNSRPPFSTDHANGSVPTYPNPRVTEVAIRLSRHHPPQLSTIRPQGRRQDLGPHPRDNVEKLCYITRSADHSSSGQQGRLPFGRVQPACGTDWRNHIVVSRRRIPSWYFAHRGEAEDFLAGLEAVSKKARLTVSDQLCHILMSRFFKHYGRVRY